MRLHPRLRVRPFGQPRLCYVFVLLLILAAFLASCAGSARRQVKKAVSEEFSLLKALDPEMLSDYYADESILQETGLELAVQESAQGAQQSVSSASSPRSEGSLLSFLGQFFRSFSYRILSVSVEDTSASVSVKITTLDGKSLARDYAEWYLKAELKTGFSDTQQNSETGSNDSSQDSESGNSNGVTDTQQFNGNGVLEDIEGLSLATPLTDALSALLIVK